MRRSFLLFGVAALAGCEAPQGQATPEPSTSGSSTASPGPTSMKRPAGGKNPAGGEPIPAPADVAAPPADAIKTASGLVYKVQTAGTGTEHPEATDKVKVHYTGWTTNGEMFDSSVTRGQPSSFPLNGVIKGWTEGVQLMVVGEKTRFWIPAALAYGENPGGGKPGGQLTFDIELLEVKKKPKPPPAPADVAAPPADAKTTKSGLAYKVLTPGTGTEHPAAHDGVKVHYTGWTTDGKSFESTITRGLPADLTLSNVRGLLSGVAGFNEGVQLMVQGEKTLFWIPASLAYGDTPEAGRPAGMLVVEVELIDLKRLPAPPPVPKDVDKPPADAKKTASGLHYKVLTKGKGKVKPTPANKVEVHYTGWQTNGKMFDSSVTRGKPAQFGVQGVIKGWTEGLQLMVEGEKTRFWIPADLAYGDDPKSGKPTGMLVFDVELLKIM